MKLFLWFTLFTIFTVHFTQAGIYRRYVRRHPRPRPPVAHDRIGRREFQQVYRPRPWPGFYLRRPRSPWTFGPPRMARRFRFHNEQRADHRVPHFHHQPAATHYSAVPPMTPRLPPTNMNAWRPLDYGNPIDRDPTYDYAPPSVERVRFATEGRNRRPSSQAHTGIPQGPPGHLNGHGGGYTQRPHPPPPPQPSGYGRPSLWKLLAHKQRPKRPYPPPHNARQPPMRYHGQSPNHPLYHHQVYQGEAEIFPRIPNIVYFQPKDVVSKHPIPGHPHQQQFHHHHPGPIAPGTPTKLVQPGNLKPGSVSDAPLYSGEIVAAKSEFNPVAVVKPTVGGNKEYLFTVVGYKGPSGSISSTSTSTTPMSVTRAENYWGSESNSNQQSVVPAPSTTKRTPTVLHAVKTTPVTISTTHNSVVKPFEPTESLLDQQNHHNNHNHRDDEIEESAEESIIVEKVVENTENHLKKIRLQKGKEPEPFDLDDLDMVPPAPIVPVIPVIPNSFNILDSSKLDQDDSSSASSSQESEIPATVNIMGMEIPANIPKKIRRPVFNSNKNIPSDASFKTSTSVSVSVSKTDEEIQTKAPERRTTSTTIKTTTTPKPTTSTQGTTTTIETTPRSTTTSSTTTTTTAATTPKATKFPRLPTMPTYKKKAPVYARKTKTSMNGPFSKYSSSSSSSALSKEINGSGEIVVITAGRSKVKEYKPQFIADNTQLLSFDKVADGSSTISSVGVSTPSPPTTTAKSVLQEFDPMQLLHSWFNKKD